MGTKQRHIDRFGRRMGTKISVNAALRTDVEGNWDYFARYCARSRVVSLDPDGSLSLRDDGCYFVYGGDVCDNGPGDLRLCQLLVSLKRRHPDRVALLSGNRDLNKLRMTAELEQAPPPSPDPNRSRRTSTLTRTRTRADGPRPADGRDRQAVLGRQGPHPPAAARP